MLNCSWRLFWGFIYDIEQRRWLYKLRNIIIQVNWEKKKRRRFKVKKEKRNDQSSGMQKIKGSYRILSYLRIEQLKWPRTVIRHLKV